MGSASILLALAGILPASFHGVFLQRHRTLRIVGLLAAASGNMPAEASRMLALPIANAQSGCRSGDSPILCWFQ
jgi:hypothetical protein